MESRIAEVMSRILSEKHDAKIKITFKERKDEQRRDNHGVGRNDINARKRNRKTKA